MKRSLVQKLGLLGVLSFLSYTAAVVFSPLAYPGYNWMAQAVSDLSAANAPSLALWNRLSAAELESRCRKCQRIETDNASALVRALDRLGAEYAVSDETDADVFMPFSVTRLAQCAEAEGCEIRSIRERDESLESFYMELVGGGDRHD